VIDAIRAGADAAVPALPVADTLKRVDGTRVLATIARDDLVAVQTPQAFRLDALRAAHRGEHSATDDAALVEQHGGCVVVVPGEFTNFKITAPSDLDVAEAILAPRGGVA
jgi:2-C-methyl-D-erythritol 4-phosphate cytidylyltransferase